MQRRAARYKRTDSVTAMLDELGWPILSKRRKDARLILFYKIINNLAQVPHEHILTKAYEGTRKKNNHKFRHIAVNTSQYRQSFFPKTVGPWNQLSFADSPTLEIAMHKDWSLQCHFLVLKSGPPFLTVVERGRFSNLHYD